MNLGYHGTSLEHALGILKDGYKNTRTKFWSVSTGNMHLFKQDHFNLAAYQALNAAVICPSLKRAVVVIDLKNKKLKEDSRCQFQGIAFEVVSKVTPNDIVGIYSDVKPFNPILKVIQKVAICKMHNQTLFNSDLIKLNSEEQELFDILQEVKLSPNYKSTMELLYKRSDYKEFNQYVEVAF
jgi:hypothetical protein